MKGTRTAKKTKAPDAFLMVRQAKLGYFKAIKKAKASDWSDFLAKTSPNNVWTAKGIREMSERGPRWS